jgi:hypothetical protein
MLSVILGGIYFVAAFLLYRAQRHLRALHRLTLDHNLQLMDFCFRHTAPEGRPELEVLLRRQTGEMRELIERGG